MVMLLSNVPIKYDKSSELEHLQQWPSTSKVAYISAKNKPLQVIRTNPLWSSREIFLTGLLTFVQIGKVELKIVLAHLQNNPDWSPPRLDTASKCLTHILSAGAVSAAFTQRRADNCRSRAVWTDSNKTSVSAGGFWGKLGQSRKRCSRTCWLFAKMTSLELWWNKKDELVHADIAPENNATDFCTREGEVCHRWQHRKFILLLFGAVGHFLYWHCMRLHVANSIHLL